MKKFGLTGAIITALIPIIGIISPIIWDYYNSSKSLTVTENSTTTIINSSVKLDGLKISYNGEELDALYIISFTIENTGNSPIRSAHVVSPLSLIFDKKFEGNILDAKIDSTDPKNSEAQIIIQDNRNIVLTFPLLNPEDKVNFSIISRNDNLHFNVNARIEDIKNVEYKKQYEGTTPKSKKFSFISITVGFFTLFSFIAIIMGINFYNKEKSTIKLLKNNTLPLPVFQDESQASRWIDDRFDFTLSEARSLLKNDLNSLVHFHKLSQEKQKDLTLNMYNTLTSINAQNVPLIVIFSILFVVGSVYLIDTTTTLEIFGFFK